MNGRVTVKLKGLEVPLWFNNYSKVELAKMLLPAKNGFSGKPEEIELLRSIRERAEDNHILLMRDLVIAGHKGHVYGISANTQVREEAISEAVAEADQAELYGAWVSFLDAYGFNLDVVIEEAKKKRLLTQKMEKLLTKN